MTALSPSQLRRHRKRSGQGKELPNSDNNRTNQSPPLVVSNEYGSNLGLMHQANIPPDVDLDHLGEFIEEVGYSIPHPIGILRYIRPVDGIWVYEADTKKTISPASLNLHST